MVHGSFVVIVLLGMVVPEGFFGEEPGVPVRVKKSIQQIRAARIPSEDEPARLIRYLKVRNAVLEKELAELRSETDKLQRRLEKYENPYLTPGSTVPEAVDRGMLIPMQQRF